MLSNMVEGELALNTNLNYLQGPQVLSGPLTESIDSPVLSKSQNCKTLIAI
jgi:hypothetical protein